MDRVKRFLFHRIKSSSIIEVITAMVIISMVFTIASMVYLNVQRSAFSSKRLVAEIAINEVLSASLRGEIFQAREVLVNDITVYQTILPYRDSGSLKVLELEARDPSGKLLAIRRRLIQPRNEL